MTCSPVPVTHRLIRSVQREETTRDHSEGVESVPVTVTVWEVTCACHLVFRADTDTEAAGKYLDHLPKPPTEKRG